QYRITKETNINEVIQDIHHTFTFTFVIKPNRQRSTLCLTVVENQHETKDSIRKTIQSDHYILVEQYSDGIELTVPVMGKMGEEEALPIIEIVPKNDLYDYEAKYTEGGSEHIIPARIDDNLTEKIQQYAVLAHQVLGCK